MQFSTFFSSLKLAYSCATWVSPSTAGALKCLVFLMFANFPNKKTNLPGIVALDVYNNTVFIGFRKFGRPHHTLGSPLIHFTQMNG